MAENGHAGSIDTGIRLQIIQGTGKAPPPGGQGAPGVAVIACADSRITGRIGNDILAAEGGDGVAALKDGPDRPALLLGTAGVQFVIFPVAERIRQGSQRN